MTKKIFISYVRENTKEIDLICKEFKKQDILFWLDREDIGAGSLWKASINKAISSGAYFLACFSREYADKTDTHMNEEINVAIEKLRSKPFDSGWFIPIKLSECDIPPYDIGASGTLNDIHHLKFYEDWDAELKRLVDFIKREEEETENHNIAGYIDSEYIYMGLKSLIEAGSGWGFHNADMGHPVYRLGASKASEKTLKTWEYADSPEKSHLFKMISQVSKKLKQSGIEDYRYIWWYDFSEWRDFCKFVINVYDKKRKSE